jgi:hypothetical protein
LQKRHCKSGTPIAETPGAVDIRFTSTLTSEDENIVAPAILTALASILDLLPIAYMLRIDSVDSHVFQHTGPATKVTSLDRYRSRSGAFVAGEQ